MKQHAQLLMDRRGAPDNMWFLTMDYIAHVQNHCAKGSIGWKIPLQVQQGETNDISHLLCFSFFQPILYYDPDISFPESKEKPGYFVGFAPNVGDSYCYKILIKDMKAIIHRSVVHDAKDYPNRNKRVQFSLEIDDELEKYNPMAGFAGSSHDKKPSSKGTQKPAQEQITSPRTRSQRPKLLKSRYTLLFSEARAVTSNTICWFLTHQWLKLPQDFKCSHDEPKSSWDLQQSQNKISKFSQAVSTLASPALKQNLFIMKQSEDNNVNDTEGNPDHELWHMKEALMHRCKPNKAHTSVTLLVIWENMSQPQWVDLNSLVLHDP